MANNSDNGRRKGNATYGEYKGNIEIGGMKHPINSTQCQTEFHSNVGSMTVVDG